MCMPRGRGRLSKTVAMSLAREDHTTTPRWRARATRRSAARAAKRAERREQAKLRLQQLA